MADTEPVYLHHPDLPADQVIVAPTADHIDYFGASGWKPVPKTRQKAAAEAITTPDKEK